MSSVTINDNYDILLYEVNENNLMGTINENNNRKLLAITSIISVIILVALFGYWRYDDYFPSTDDAYVHANIIDIAAQVTAPIKSVAVKNNDTVDAEQVILKLDPRSYQLVVDKTTAALQLAKQGVGASVDAIQSAKAKVNQVEAQYRLAKQNAKRILVLVKDGKASKAEGDKIKSAVNASQAALEAAKAELKRAQQNLGDAGENNANIQQAQAALSQAKLDLSHTLIKAPAAGTIENFQLRPGSMVIAGNPLFSIVETGEWWISANFKETQLARIKPGQKATIRIDMYPGRTFHGVVKSISSGSGSVFSLLPAENASGNWVKVTQRFPVRIEIIAPTSKYPLRVGASSDVTIDTWHDQ